MPIHYNDKTVSFFTFFCIIIIFFTGQIISVVAEVSIFSSEEMSLKFSLQQRVKYRAEYSVHVRDHSLCRVTEDTFRGNSQKTATCQMKIPDRVVPTIRNCEIISVEYYLKVWKDDHYNQITPA